MYKEIKVGMLVRETHSVQPHQRAFGIIYKVKAPVCWVRWFTGTPLLGKMDEEMTFGAVRSLLVDKGL